MGEGRRYVVAPLCLTLAAVALGDGVMMAPRPEFPAMEAGQRAVIIDEGATEGIVFQVTYRGARSNFAWVIPVPGRPGPGDVDQGSQYFLDSVEAMTSPTVYTEGPRRLHGLGLAKMSPSKAGGMGRAGGPGEAPTVVELERLHAGPYEVSVLEATGKGVLGDWLRARGFPMAPEVDRELDGYVGRGWYFLATRVATVEGGGESASIWQGDLPPLAVRFPRPEKLVYPLAISRAGVADRCVLDLLILAPKAVDCDEAPAVEPTGGGGGSIWRLLDRATRGGRSSVLLASLPALPLRAMTSYMSGHLKPKELRWSGLAATRLWLRPTKERMVDLHFTVKADAETQAARLEIHRKAPMGLPSIIAVLIVLVLIGAAIWLFVTNKKACCGINVLAMLATMGLAWAGFSSISSFYRYNSAARTITEAIKQFHDKTGSFPARVADLTAAQAPATALDASGNEVALTAPAGWQPLLDELPEDPVARLDSAWIVDLAAPGYVSSGAFRIGVKWDETPAAASDPYGQRPRGPRVEPGAALAPKAVVPARAVAIARGPSGAALPIWIGQDDVTMEFARNYGMAPTVGAGPKAASIVALVASLDAPPGQEDRWCAPVVVHGDGKVDAIGTEPIPGAPVAVTMLGGTSAIVAATAVPEESSETAGRRSGRTRELPAGLCSIYRVEPDKTPRKVAEVRGLRGLAEVGDGRNVLVVHGQAPAAGGATRFTVGLIDLATGRVTDVDGATDVVGGRDGGWIVGREGYAWFATGGGVLKRRAPEGKIEAMLEAPVAGGEVSIAVAPGPKGEALVLVPEAGGGTKVMRVGAGAPHAVAHLNPATTGERRTSPEDPRSVAWPPEGIADTDAFVTAAHSYEKFVVAIRRTGPRLRLVSNAAEMTKTRGGADAGRVQVALRGTEPQKQFLGAPRGIMRVCDAKPGWLAAVKPSDQIELSLSPNDRFVLGITRVERGGRAIYLVGDHVYPVVAAGEAPSIDMGLDGFALVYEPLGEANWRFRTRGGGRGREGRGSPRGL